MYTVERALLDASTFVDGATEKEKMASFMPTGRSLYLVMTEMTAPMRELGKLMGLNILMTTEKVFQHEGWLIFQDMPNGDVVMETFEEMRATGFIEYWERVEAFALIRLEKFVKRSYKRLGSTGTYWKAADGTLNDSLVLESFCVLLNSTCVSVFVFFMELFKNRLQPFYHKRRNMLTNKYTVK